ncbi:MAG TPA: nitrile hydratase subunit beta [Pseudolabrys sp.]|nr:nitrile hydratase subunit beta [Pseudolabrys sp.]
MNGAQDMGGMQGFGPVVKEPNEPVFHDDWERRAFALTMAMGATGLWNIDIGRAARESLPPAQYLTNSYYKIWFTALEKLIAERGLVAPDEVAAGKALHPAKPVRTAKPQDIAKLIDNGTPYTRTPPAPARFKVGERVRAKVMNPATHTRLPRYVRGHTGIVEHVRGCHSFPDSCATGRGENPQWLYTVSFSGRELWGAEADASVKVSVDAWEPYLEPA